MNTVRIGKTMRGRVYCPICTHSVEAEVEVSAKKPRVLAGQKCPRCRSLLDAGFVLQLPEAA